VRFEFLAPDAAAAAGGERPPLRSPIEWSHREAGANLARRAGWNVVSDYGDPERETAACSRSVGVADLSCLGKVEVQAAPAAIDGIAAELAGGPLELGRARLHDGVWWCPMSPSRVIAVTQPEDTARVREALESADSGGSFAAVVETTAAWGSNALVGPLSRETFARTMALDLRPQSFPELAFAPVSVARTPGLVLRAGGDAFVHLFGAGYADYNWTVFVDAAESLGGRAVGHDALPEALMQAPRRVSRASDAVRASGDADA
jgi:glycine cleavage system aminomethyltransferase T